MVAGAAPALGSGLPLLAARLVFLLLLVAPAAWSTLPVRVRAAADPLCTRKTPAPLPPIHCRRDDLGCAVADAPTTPAPRLLMDGLVVHAGGG